MKEFKIDIEGKNTLNIIETDTGVILVLNQTEVKKPEINEPYYYVAFNVIKGFFVWNSIWHDSEMDNALYEAGNCFYDKNEPESISSGFNSQLKFRLHQSKTS